MTWCIHISPVGDILAYASTDLSIGLIDAQTLKVNFRCSTIETPMFMQNIATIKSR